MKGFQGPWMLGDVDLPGTCAICVDCSHIHLHSPREDLEMGNPLPGAGAKVGDPLGDLK